MLHQKPSPAVFEPSLNDPIRMEIFLKVQGVRGGNLTDHRMPFLKKRLFWKLTWNDIRACSGLWLHLEALYIGRESQMAQIKREGPVMLNDH